MYLLERHSQLPIMRKASYGMLRAVHFVLDDYRDRKKKSKQSILMGVSNFFLFLPPYFFIHLDLPKISIITSK